MRYFNENFLAFSTCGDEPPGNQTGKYPLDLPSCTQRQQIRLAHPAACVSRAGTIPQVDQFYKNALCQPLQLLASQPLIDLVSMPAKSAPQTSNLKIRLVG